MLLLDFVDLVLDRFEFCVHWVILALVEILVRVVEDVKIDQVILLSVPEHVVLNLVHDRDLRGEMSGIHRGHDTGIAV